MQQWASHSLKKKEKEKQARSQILQSLLLETIEISESVLKTARPGKTAAYNHLCRRNVGRQRNLRNCDEIS